MIRGTADLLELARNAPDIGSYPADMVLLNDVVCLQATMEMRNSAREAVLPTSLHPTIPASMSVQVWKVGDSPWGAFAFAMTRISCRSGVRARGFVSAAFATTPAATRALRNHYGFPIQLADVTLQHNYSGASAQVRWNERVVLDLRGVDPEPMGHDDVQYTGSLTLANTPNGLRLVQVEADYHSTQVERLRPTLHTFSGADWGNALLVPACTVSASVALAAIELPPIRFVCRADELAFTGTESVKLDA